MASCRNCHHCSAHRSLVYYTDLLRRYSVKLEDELCHVQTALVQPMDDDAKANLIKRLEKCLTDALKSPEDETVDAYRYGKED